MSDWNDDAPAADVGGGELTSTIAMPEIKLFGKWSTLDVDVGDMSLTVNI